ncbi:uncharacterized protein LOC129252979 [Anastrepha obliqua]|uniref:uncharacterized protein LOC129252979 n=1 Tax=Anastrepha obliqua TaxID=95512 RepID=UPI002408FFF8|nr:uncharacterized protein LOC129252979 [Anastrepha obliqua]
MSRLSNSQNTNTIAHEIRSEGNIVKQRSILKITPPNSDPGQVTRHSKGASPRNSDGKVFTSTSSDHSEGSLQRRAHFDQRNIEKTYKPRYKDYGYIKITQAATPFPHRTLGLDSALHKPTKNKRLTEEMRKSLETKLPRAFTSTRLSSAVEMDFETKRKRFNEGEFTITRQRRPMVVHPPLQSIGDLVHLRFPQSSHNLTRFFRKYNQRNSTKIGEKNIVHR